MIYILTGPVHSGKTTLLTQITRSLREKGLKIDGFLSVPVWKGNERTGYNLYDLGKEESFPFICTTGEATWEKIGSYYFIPDGLEKAKNILLKTRDASLLVVDEVGPLELSGKGLWPVLRDILSHRGGHHLLVVRESVLRDFMEMLKDSDVEVFHFQDEDIFARIIGKLTKSLAFGPIS